jgi:dTDP-4-dehydrorhamnose 3,5-epimerase
MKIAATNLPEIFVLEPAVHGDERGFFFESFNQKRFEEAIGRKTQFVQDNHSRSVKGVLRGLHYQITQPQAKLIRALQGEIFDVAVDLRRHSATFGKWSGTVLSAENKKQMWVPEGFAHGFVVTSETAEILYKVTDYYAPQHERSLLWNDAAIAIAWPLDGAPILSLKDRIGAPLAQAEVFA